MRRPRLGVARLDERSGVYAVNVLEEGKGEALAWLDCRVESALVAGDHTIFVGEVVAADTREGTPLLYYRGGYGRFES